VVAEVFIAVWLLVFVLLVSALTALARRAVPKKTVALIKAVRIIHFIRDGVLSSLKF
jgi:hypothetical protein